MEWSLGSSTLLGATALGAGAFADVGQLIVERLARAAVPIPALDRPVRTADLSTILHGVDDDLFILTQPFVEIVSLHAELGELSTHILMCFISWIRIRHGFFLLPTWVLRTLRALWPGIWPNKNFLRHME
ncbi:MAG: hypothetical protein A2909_00930 [Candidatus Tagabacteria bacterium RIFCSPLOWO2_01_FULL_39_11]|uniref:Uncharacterized protein n=1 Tax=Candidatus Tagabacteria bacterium RIFCSPLOWO2_01_FULL_39_11 TaxID=1802295 RepID=A0A1G2LPG9_9BACT|nr:MAG: hypothetical protein A2909_00930 [Candidatus Tagabacteria bacterium RIFCSPLOWO2_01_FULL_39_11]